ncbi:hypothetical protein SPBR_06203 [Sporothrix brasiliensis 5110]|uniref:NADH dehydrogenase [ubiquinone] 1 alpha subcomplex subunit 1 n=1 Tax=Sporothrix brasiliensis 5110 TaxID=1398154 RepID=A0A0C2IYP3_9PEZI|nr:uncharacterized protein SPBR_06203 [Sporothrix brasiliensis 5110]KIH94186.1 hypothetical protein SPBR_06203 [Sporothrix brasiliensis 5110]
MPVPFETLIPYGIMIVMFGVSGAGLSKIRHMQNGGKRARRSTDQWDRCVFAKGPNDDKRSSKCISNRSWTNSIEFVVMDRDRRLTGLLRGQTDNPSAPPGFEVNNPWRLEKRFS